MKDDPAIEIIREVRRRISTQFGDNTSALVKHYQELEKQYAGRMLRPEKVAPDRFSQ